MAHQLELSESTWHRCQNQYGAMLAHEAKSRRELRIENQRLNKTVANQILDIDMLNQL